MEQNIKTNASHSNSDTNSSSDNFEYVYSQMITHFHDNLETFMDVNNLTANSLAIALDCSEKTINAYKTSRNIADAKRLGRIKTVYDISLDDFLFRKMSPEELIRKNNSFHRMMHYKGLYIIYYLSTESFKGSETREATESLRYGLIYITESELHKSDTHLECVAVLGIEDKQILFNLYSKYQNYIDSRDDSALISSMERHNPDRFYRGQLRVDKDHYYLTLSHLNESVLMIGYAISEQEGRMYRGGLVTVNSVSRGRENAPVLQLAGLSRYFLDCNDEEMEVALHLCHKIELVDEADKIFEFIKNPPGYLNNSDEHRLKDEQLKAIITADIEYEIRRIIEKRVYHNYKMISSEDNLFYHYLKTRLKGPKDDRYGKGQY